eukprot:scaffold11797_cov123-Isochrysis_galbana.AAC.15
MPRTAHCTARYRNNVQCNTGHRTGTLRRRPEGGAARTLKFALLRTHGYDWMERFKRMCDGGAHGAETTDETITLESAE